MLGIPQALHALEGVEEEAQDFSVEGGLAAGVGIRFAGLFALIAFIGDLLRVLVI